MKLSIIIPAYNEEKRILPTLENYYSFFEEKLGKDFEIIVIPNNCNDKTFELSETFSKQKKNVIVKNFPFYTGKGGAVKRGFELAKGELIGFTDADGSTNAENFFKLFTNIENHEGIIASRKIKGAEVFPRRRFFQDISSFLFNIASRILLNLKYKDTQCGAKLFQKKTAKFLAKNSAETGWIFDVDFLYLCKNNSKKIREFPIKWKDSEGSKLTFLSGINSFLSLMKYSLRNRFFLKHPEKRS